MRFGLLYTQQNPPQWRRPYADVYAEIFEQIEWAETIGYDDVWMTEHHSAEDGHAPAPLVLAAAAAARTKTIRIGTAASLIALYHPVRFAEDCATIDVISGGRFQLGVASGFHLEDFSTLGIPRNQRARRTEEALEILRKLFDRETVSWDSDLFQFERARLTPEPVQEGGPPIWVGGFKRPAIRRAAKWGDGFLGFGDLSETWPVYLEELEKAGRPASDARVMGGHAWMVVSDEPDKTFHEIAPHVLYTMNQYAEWYMRSGFPLFPVVDTVEELRSTGLLLVLSPEQAIAELKRMTAIAPMDHYFTFTVPPGYPAAKMNEHLETFATKVMPHFRSDPTAGPLTDRAAAAAG